MVLLALFEVSVSSTGVIVYSKLASLLTVLSPFTAVATTFTLYLPASAGLNSLRSSLVFPLTVYENLTLVS